MEKIRICDDIPQKIKHQIRVIQRNGDTDEPVAVCGILFGWNNNGEIDILTCSFVRSDLKEQSRAVVDDLVAAVPSGLDIVGVLSVPADINKVRVCVEPLEILTDDQPVFIFGSDEQITVIDTNDYQIETVISFVSRSVLLACTVTLLVNSNQSLVVESDEGKSEDDVRGFIRSGINSIGTQLCESNVFFVPKNVKLLFSAENDDKSIVLGQLSSSNTCLDLWKASQADPDDKALKRKELVFDDDRLLFDVVTKITNPVVTNGLLSCAPLVQMERKHFKSTTIPLHLTGVTVCNQMTKISDVGLLLRNSLLKQLDLVQNCLLRHSSFTHMVNQFVVPHWHLFMPEKFGFFISTSYPAQIEEEKLMTRRRELHTLFNIPMRRPVFRRGNHFLFPEERGPYLRNVHLHAKSSGVGGNISLVSGLYQYHHYMQDDFNDNGWGCAYRSFQTVWSWFFLQGYTEQPVPTHAQIQQALVDVGDKDIKFVGSRLWVGSLELSYCLDHMLAISSRILTANNGAEMASRARELAAHFETQGTPIMIGGGVLAHTILGVDFNDSTGDVKFLVLDPHYTGSEDIKTIISKGWCGWKPPSFWKDDCFYNMLLPEVPKVI